MSDSQKDLEKSLEKVLQGLTKKWIRSIDGLRMMEYDGLAHRCDNLNLIEVTRILSYHGGIIIIYHIGLFDNPSFLLSRIRGIFSKIRLYDPDQQEDILNFFMWLKDRFMPFLARAEQYIPDVRNQADRYLLERGIPTIENMLILFQKHFIVRPLMVLRSIFAIMGPNRMIRNRFSRNSPITRLALAILHGNRFEVLPVMAARVGFPIEELTMLLSNLENLSRIQGKPFYGKLLTIAVAQNFLIQRLFCAKNLREEYLVSMRLLSC